MLWKIFKDYLNCYSFIKLRQKALKLKDKSIIDSLENSADVSLKYNYDLGEIMGLNPSYVSNDEG